MTSVIIMFQNFKTPWNVNFQVFSPPSELVNSYASYLIKFLSKLLNRYFPIKTKMISSKRIKSPWITPAILRCISKKHRWTRLYSDGIITARSYKSYSGELRRLLRTAEDEYYVRKFSSLNGDMKRKARRTGRPDSVCWQKLTSRAAIRLPDTV